MPRSLLGAALVAALVARHSVEARIGSAFDVPIAEAFTGAVVGIFSMVTPDLSGERARDGLRQTWLHDDAVHTDLGKRISAREGKSLRHDLLTVFVVGKPHTSDDSSGGESGAKHGEWLATLARLKIENASYGDIVYLPVVEDLLNFRKPEAWYKFAVRRFPLASHIARVDEDVYIRGSCMGPVLQRMPKTNFYWGWASFGAAQLNSFRKFPIVGSRSHHYKSVGIGADESIGHACEPYANGGFIWVSRDVATRMVKSKAMVSDPSNPYPFVGEDLFFSCFVNKATGGNAPLHMLVGATNVRTRDLHSEETWHERRNGIFSELVYGQQVQARTLVVHGKNFAKIRFGAQLSSSRLAKELVLVGKAHHVLNRNIEALLAEIKNGAAPTSTSVMALMPALQQWNLHVLQITAVGDALRRKSTLEKKRALTNKWHYAYITPSENRTHSKIGDVEHFIHGCVNRTQVALTYWALYFLGLIENNLTPSLEPPAAATIIFDSARAHCAQYGATFRDLVPAKTMPAAGSVAPMVHAAERLQSWIAAANRTLGVALLSMAHALGSSAANTLTLFDSVMRSKSHPTCPVPWLPRALPGTTPPTDGAQCGCTWYDRFVPYQAASSMRYQFRTTDAHSAILDQRSFSAFAFDCDMTTSWNSAWIKPDSDGSSPQCEKIAAVQNHHLMAELPQWVRFPVQPAHNREDSIIAAFSIRAVSFGNLKSEMVRGPWPRLKLGTGAPALSSDDEACNMVSPRSWFLQASPREGMHAGKRWESLAASSTSDTPWACGEERWYTILDDERIDINQYNLRLLVNEVGGTFGACNTTFVGISEISVRLEGEAEPNTTRGAVCGGRVRQEWPTPPPRARSNAMQATTSTAATPVATSPAATTPVDHIVHAVAIPVAATPVPTAPVAITPATAAANPEVTEKPALLTTLPITQPALPIKGQTFDVETIEVDSGVTMDGESHTGENQHEARPQRMQRNALQALVASVLLACVLYRKTVAGVAMRMYSVVRRQRDSVLPLRSPSFSPTNARLERERRRKEAKEKAKKKKKKKREKKEKKDQRHRRAR